MGDAAPPLWQTGRIDNETYIRLLRKWWWLLLTAFIVGGGAAYGVSLQLTPTYQATTTLLVVQRPSEGASV